MFGMGASVFAASPQARDAVLSSQSQVLSVDNTYLLETDLSDFDLALRVTAVTEDDESYFVSYAYTSIEPVEYVWKPVEIAKTITVSKKEIQDTDLGLYVSKQLGELLRQEVARLEQVQTLERDNGASRKVVATEYSGLVGRFLDPTEEVFEGYTPVIEPKEEEVAESTGGCQADCDGVVAGASTATPAAADGKFRLQVLGDTLVRLSVGSTYTDLGALLYDGTNPASNRGYSTYLNGTRVTTVVIDTSMPADHEIEYRAKNGDGKEVTARRFVLVESADEAPGGSDEEPAEESAPEEVVEPEPTVTPEPTPAPAPQPEPTPEPEPAPEPEPTPEPTPESEEGAQP